MGVSKDRPSALGWVVSFTEKRHHERRDPKARPERDPKARPEGANRASLGLAERCVCDRGHAYAPAEHPQGSQR